VPESGVIGEDFITTTQAAELTGYSVTYVRQLARLGTIEAVRAGRDWLVERGSLLAYQQEMERLGPAKHNPWRETHEQEV
jgi:excisionase family DNA binding protein